LASELTGWELNVMSEIAGRSEERDRVPGAARNLHEAARRRRRRCEHLVQEGFSTIEEIAYVPASELNAIEEFDEEIVKSCARARATCC